MKTAVKEKGLNKWGNILEEIFGVEVNYTEITNKERIAEILDRINNSAQIHMFFPGGGGLGNFMKVQYNGREIDFVENGGKAINRIPIRKLEYNCIGNSPNWSYIRLEAEESDSITGISGYYEEYGELEDGTILNRSMWDEGYYMNNEGEREYTIKCETYNKDIKRGTSYFCNKIIL